jgi:hypothetical protein
MTKKRLILDGNSKVGEAVVYETVRELKQAQRIADLEMYLRGAQRVIQNLHPDIITFVEARELIKKASVKLK